jgi:hypothetical protein
MTQEPSDPTPIGSCSEGPCAFTVGEVHPVESVRRSRRCCLTRPIPGGRLGWEPRCDGCGVARAERDSRPEFDELSTPQSQHRARARSSPLARDSQAPGVPYGDHQFRVLCRDQGRSRADSGRRTTTGSGGPVSDDRGPITTSVLRWRRCARPPAGCGTGCRLRSRGVCAPAPQHRRSSDAGHCAFFAGGPARWSTRRCEADNGCAVDRRREVPSMHQPAGRDAHSGCFEGCVPPHPPLGEHASQPGEHAQGQGVADHE